MDSIFISGRFLEDCLPREKQYLYQYFRTELQVAFVRYAQLFDDYRRFTDHTGHACKLRNLQILARKLRHIESFHRAAKSAMDFDELERIENGGIRLDHGKVVE